MVARVLVLLALSAGASAATVTRQRHFASDAGNPHPLQVTSATVTSASPKVLAVEGGTEVVVTGTGFAGDAAVCRVDPAPGGSTHLINATTPLVNASVASATTLSCVAPAVSAPAPGLLKVSLDGGETWVGAGVEIAYAEQVSVALDRRPYVGEASGHLLVRSSIPGVDALNVTAELPCVGASWRWDDVKANADVVLDLGFSALSAEPIHNDMIVTLSLPREPRTPSHTIETSRVGTTRCGAKLPQPDRRRTLRRTAQNCLRPGTPSEPLESRSRATRWLMMMTSLILSATGCFK